MNYLEVKELQGVLASEFDIGARHQRIVGENIIEISAREERLYELMKFLHEKYNAVLIWQIADLESNSENVHVLMIHHLKLRIHIKSGIDIRNNKAISLKRIFPTAGWLEKYQSFFFGLKFKYLIGKEGEPGLDRGPELSSVPWVNKELDDFINKLDIPDAGGIFDPKLDMISYNWAKIKQNKIVKSKSQLGHFHNGVLKFLEKLPADKIPFIIPRLCWNDKFHFTLGTCYVLEDLMMIEDKIPFIARIWRALACELERILNHHKFIASWFSIIGQNSLLERNKRLISDLTSLEEKYFIDEKGELIITPGGLKFNPTRKFPGILNDLYNKMRMYEINVREL
ncbi:MAG: hypothetical protein ACTSXP_09340, partial [Promethearchaeota archaeon]